MPKSDKIKTTTKFDFKDFNFDIPPPLAPDVVQEICVVAVRHFLEWYLDPKCGFCYHLHGNGTIDFGNYNLLSEDESLDYQIITTSIDDLVTETIKYEIDGGDNEFVDGYCRDLAATLRRAADKVDAMYREHAT